MNIADMIAFGPKIVSVEATQAVKRKRAPSKYDAPVLAALGNRRMTANTISEISGIPRVKTVCDALAAMEKKGLVVRDGKTPNKRQLRGKIIWKAAKQEIEDGKDGCCARSG